jgi:3alpha(or 20beta)-hydroxysteroid dehydrogenase
MIGDIAVKRLTQEVALVTGGARGMGASHVRSLASEGACVVFGDVNDSLGTALEEELARAGLEATYVHLDVRSAADWRQAVALAEERYSSLTILVNNAGVLGRGGGLLACDDFEDVVAVNEIGPFLGMQTAVPAFLRAGRGSIVNIASVAAEIPAGPIAYSASKAALRMMTFSAAYELGPSNIRANVVSPGMIKTPMVGTGGAEPEQGLEAKLKRIPLRRIGEPADVSEAVVFLCTASASYISGTEIVVDGGRVKQLLA